MEGAGLGDMTAVDFRHGFTDFGQMPTLRDPQERVEWEAAARFPVEEDLAVMASKPAFWDRNQCLEVSLSA